MLVYVASGVLCFGFGYLFGRRQKELSFNEYQDKSGETAVYPEVGTGSPLEKIYIALGIIGEAGELAGSILSTIESDEILSDERLFDYRLAVQAARDARAQDYYKKALRDPNKKIKHLEVWKYWSGLSVVDAIKEFRNEDPEFAIQEEIGGSLWYAQQTCTIFNIEFSDCAEFNMKQLSKRAREGKLITGK